MTPKLEPNSAMSVIATVAALLSWPALYTGAAGRVLHGRPRPDARHIKANSVSFRWRPGENRAGVGFGTIEISL